MGSEFHVPVSPLTIAVVLRTAVLPSRIQVSEWDTATGGGRLPQVFGPPGIRTYEF